MPNNNVRDIPVSNCYVCPKPGNSRSNARLLLQTARDHANRGEYSTAVKLGEEAWLLNPLDAATTCEYLHLLKVTKGSLDTKHSKDVENVLSAVSLNGEELCRDLSTAQ